MRPGDALIDYSAAESVAYENGFEELRCNCIERKALIYLTLGQKMLAARQLVSARFGYRKCKLDSYFDVSVSLGELYIELGSRRRARFLFERTGKESSDGEIRRRCFQNLAKMEIQDAQEACEDKKWARGIERIHAALRYLKSYEELDLQFNALMVQATCYRNCGESTLFGTTKSQLLKLAFELEKGVTSNNPDDLVYTQSIVSLER